MLNVKQEAVNTSFIACGLTQPGNERWFNEGGIQRILLEIGLIEEMRTT